MKDKMKDFLKRINHDKRLFRVLGSGLQILLGVVLVLTAFGLIPVGSHLQNLQYPWLVLAALVWFGVAVEDSYKSSRPLLTERKHLRCMNQLDIARRSKEHGDTDAAFDMLSNTIEGLANDLRDRKL